MNAPSPIAVAGRIPPAPVLAILSRYRREDIEAFIAVAIDLLDLADGDADREEDDPHGECSEDGINTSLARARHGGPGCQISDGDSGVEDWPHDPEEDLDVNAERG